jgi:hypothetical protein
VVIADGDLVMRRVRSGQRASQWGRALLVCALYVLGLGAVVIGLTHKKRPEAPSVHPLDRARARGMVDDLVPRIDPQDAFANAAILNALLDEVPHPRLHADAGCQARARIIAVQLDGRLSRVRFSGRQVCQLKRLKEVSVRQEGLGQDEVAEVAAFLLGKRLDSDVDVTRVVVPPFRFSGDSLDFLAADLGPLSAGEQLIGTYHTHPGTELTQGVLSDTDLAYMVSGQAQLGGSGRPLNEPGPHTDWLLDIVEPKWGDWNAYAHDRRRLGELFARCQSRPPCPLNELRLGGSDYNLFVRFYEEPLDEE